jgi:hypothetical protein
MHRVHDGARMQVQRQQHLGVGGARVRDKRARQRREQRHDWQAVRVVQLVPPLARQPRGGELTVSMHSGRLGGTANAKSAAPYGSLDDALVDAPTTHTISPCSCISRIMSVIAFFVQLVCTETRSGMSSCVCSM